MARPASTARRSIGLARQGVGIAQKIGSLAGVSPATTQFMGQTGNTLGILGGGVNAYLAGTNPYASDAQRGLGIASGVVSAANAGGRLAGLGSIPHAPYLTTGLDIGSIAASDMPDDRKAFNSAAKVGELAASIYGGPLGGMFAGGLTQAANHLLFPPSHYATVRRREMDTLPRGIDVTMRRILEASSPQELAAAVSDPSYISALRPRVENGRVLASGTHLPGLGGLEERLTNAAGQQQALFAAAQAGDPRAQSLLSILQGQSAQRTTDLDLLARSNKDHTLLATPQAFRAHMIGFPEPAEDAAFALLSQQMDAADRYARENTAAGTNAGEIARQQQEIAALADAMQRLGVDFGAADERRRRADAEQALLAQSMNSVGGL